MMKKLLIALLALTLLLLSPVGEPRAGAQPEGCDTRVNDTVSLLTECVTIEELRSHQAAFQIAADENGGVRASGTPGYDASGEYVAALLERAGYDVTIQPFEFSFFEETSSAFAQTAPDAKDYVNGTDYDVMRFSSGGSVAAAVEAVDLSLDDRAASTSGCEAEDFDGFTAGNIALVQRGACSFAQKAQNAEAAGAVGVLIFNQGNTPDREALLLGTLGAPGIGIPVLGTTTAVGIELAVEGASASIDVDAVSEVRNTFNVLAETPGGDPNNVVMAGAHLDSVAEGPGIQDNGTGSAAILEVALQMKNVVPHNKVRFAWWGAEESGLVGSTYYINNLTDEQLDDIALYLNFDMIGSPNFARFIYDGDGSGFGLVGPPGSAAIEKLFEDFFDSQGLAHEPTEFSGRSDYQAFINNGIPSGGLFTGAEGIKTEEQVALYGGVAGEQYDPCYHLACDTFDNISLEAFDQNSDAVAAAVITYAMDTGSVQNQIAFIAGTSPEPSGDRQLVARLAVNGYDVIVIDDDALTPESLNDAEAVIVSSSVVPTKVPAWLAETDVPLLTSEAYSFATLGLASSGKETPYTDLTIRINNDNAASPLANGHTFRPQVFATSPGAINVAGPGDEAMIIGTEASGARRPIHFAYEEGSALVDGTPAPARRVATFPIYGGNEDLNGVGDRLFDAAVEWLFG